MTKTREWTNSYKKFLKNTFMYDPIGGMVRYKETGEIAGHYDKINKKHRLNINFRGQRFTDMAHRVGFFLFHEKEALPSLDHVNRNSMDNRIRNMRPATPVEQWVNRGKPRIKRDLPIGVLRNPKNGKYRAQVTRNGRNYTIGSAFNTVLEAVEAINLRNELDGKD